MRSLILAFAAFWLSTCGGSEPDASDGAVTAPAFSAAAAPEPEANAEPAIQPSYDPALAEALRAQSDIAAGRAAEVTQADAYAATRGLIESFAIDVTLTYYTRVRSAGLELESALGIERGDILEDVRTTRILSSTDDGRLVIAETCVWTKCKRWATTSVVGYKGRLAGLSPYYDNTDEAPGCREGRVTASCICRFSFMEDYYSVPCARVLGTEAPTLETELLQWMLTRTNVALREDAPR